MIHLKLPTLVTALLLGIPSLVYAQDIRLSREPNTTELPADIQIQSADSAGGITLVVWGTTRYDADSNTVNTLRMQLVRGSTPVGEAGDFLSDAARPGGYVRVIALVDRFLILYNDHRIDSAGLYAVRVDTGGRIIGGEERFSCRVVSPVGGQGIWALGDRSRGILLAWRSRVGNDSGYYARRVTSGGEAEPEVYLGKRLLQVTQYDGMPGKYLIWMVGGQSYTSNDDGTLDTISVDEDKLSRPFYIDNDGTFWVLGNGRVVQYGSIADTEVRSSVPISLSYFLAGSESLARDTNGVLHIYFAHYTEASGNGYFHVNALPVIGDTIAGTVVNIRSQSFKKPDNLMGDYYPVSSMITGCENSHSYSVRKEFDVAIYDPGSQQTYKRFYSFPFQYSIRNGRIVDSSIAIEECTSLVPIMIQRTISVGESRVGFSLGPNAIVLTTPVAALPYDQLKPGIFETDSGLTVTWIGRAVLPLYCLGRWYPLNDYHTSISDIITVPFVCGLSSMIDPINKRLYHNDTYLRFDRASVVITSQYGVADVLVALGSRMPYGEALLKAYLPVRGKWEGYVLEQDKGVFLSSTHIRNWMYGYDPNSGRTSVVYSLDNDRQEGYTNYTVVGSTSRRVPSEVGGFAQCVPIDDQSFIATRDIHGIYSSGSDSTRTMTFSHGGDGLVAQRILGPRFLRRYYSSDLSAYTLQIYNLDGDSLHAITIPTIPGTRDPYLLQNRSDSTIVLLWGSNHGARATRFTKNLELLTYDTTVSQTQDSVAYPTGVFRNDTLFVVWEDYRHRRAEAYGAPFAGFPYHSTQVQGGDRPPGSSMLVIRSISPNPTHGASILEVELPAGPYSIELVNPLGQALRRIEGMASVPGITKVPVALEGISPGAYFVVVRGGGSMASAPLRVY